MLVTIAHVHPIAQVHLLDGLPEGDATAQSATSSDPVGGSTAGIG
jgi:hypothetical protein